jgi:hypothetical protein
MPLFFAAFSRKLDWRELWKRNLAFLKNILKLKIAFPIYRDRLFFGMKS